VANSLPSPMIGEHTREMSSPAGFSHDEHSLRFADGTFWPAEPAPLSVQEEMLG